MVLDFCFKLEYSIDVFWLVFLSAAMGQLQPIAIVGYDYPLMADSSLSHH